MFQSKCGLLVKYLGAEKNVKVWEKMYAKLLNHVDIDYKTLESC